MMLFKHNLVYFYYKYFIILISLSTMYNECIVFESSETPVFEANQKTPILYTLFGGVVRVSEFTHAYRRLRPRLD